MSRALADAVVDFRRARRRALVVGVGAMILTALGGAFFGADQFFRSYLVAVVFWIGIGVGCLTIAMLHQLTGGQWGAAIERFVEAGARTLPALGLAFLPILFWLPHLYEWARPEAAADRTLAHKALYLNVPFFVARTIVYFLLWSALAYALDRWSRAQDETADPRYTSRLKALSAFGVIAIGVTVSYAAIDWMMSLEAHWYSTVYGGMVGIGWILSALALVIAIVLLAAHRSPVGALMSDKVRIDLGNLLLTFVVLWMYLSFVQVLITWSGNEREEVAWYVARLRGGWQGIAGYLAVFQFLVPLFVLLFRAAKRSTTVMVALTALIVFSHWIDILWLVTPAFHPAGFYVHGLDFLAAIALGGLWLALFLQLLARRPIVPRHDPALPRAVLTYAER